MARFHLAGGTDAGDTPKSMQTSAGTAGGGFIRHTNDHGDVFWGPDRKPPSGGNASGGGSGDGAVSLTLPDIRWNVAILNGLAMLFTCALVGMGLWLVDRIDDKFEIADDRNREIVSAVSEIKAEQARQSAGIDEILRRLADDNPQKGDPAG